MKPDLPYSIHLYTNSWAENVKREIKFVDSTHKMALTKNSINVLFLYYL